jgi:Rrf2 family transcriptional regulator, cysteine metabolism repressor
MKISTKTRYGTRALVDLAINQKGHSPVPIKSIAERQGISNTYLEHIVAPLISGGIVTSIRGSRGGVVLARPAQDISLKEVMELLEGPSNLVECLVGSKTCPRSSLCATQDLWNDIGQAIEGVLKSTSLRDLAEKQKNKSRTENMYYI